MVCAGEAEIPGGSDHQVVASANTKYLDWGSKEGHIFGPGGVRAPAVSTLVATILGIFLFFLTTLFNTPEGVVVGFQNFAWAPK